MKPLAMIDGKAMRDALPFPALIAALRAAFESDAPVPPRHHHAMPQPDGTTATLLLMPAWQAGGYLGVKLVSVYPGNAARDLPGLHSTYLLSDSTNGAPLALLDGDEITGRRTAAVAALAADYLARSDASSLLVVGSGRVAALLADAFTAVRPIRRVEVWSRDPQKAAALTGALCDAGHDAAPVSSLRDAVGRADIVSCATLSTVPLVCGEWLRPGAHLDLIGGFTPDMREADDAAIASSRIFIDTRAASEEAGDLIAPMRAGIITPGHIRGTLADLCQGRTIGRDRDDAITTFKAVGTALADLATATLAFQTINPGGTTND